MAGKAGKQTGVRCVGFVILGRAGEVTTSTCRCAHACTLKGSPPSHHQFHGSPSPTPPSKLQPAGHRVLVAYDGRGVESDLASDYDLKCLCFHGLQRLAGLSKEAMAQLRLQALTLSAQAWHACSESPRHGAAGPQSDLGCLVGWGQHETSKT
eukprot:scaffold125195_cov44-Prasinocladus_malaysianus.AAC.3